MIIVTGARGVVGTPLCEALSSSNIPYMPVSRAVDDGALQWDLAQDPELVSDRLKGSLSGIQSLIHCAPIWLLPAHLDRLKECGLEQIVVFSSTSVLSKQGSENAQERTLVDQLKSAEQSIADFCQSQSIDLTILRPSLIYGYGRDQNVSHIAKFIKRYHLMFLVGNASGLRQPVHADDLVRTAVNCLSRPERQQIAYNLAGRDVLSYKEMVERIFRGLGRRARIISIPLGLFRFALICAAKFGRFSYTPEMANRMNQNLNYDYSAATRDLGFKPQGFLEHPHRDLPK